MDVQNRRTIWDIIEQEKQHRCIILTTHYMEEADTLGDKIAIMSSGKIECCGSSLYLKQLYGVGYQLTISIKHSDDINVNNDVKSKIDKYILPDINESELLSYAGTEISYRLPFGESKKYPELFNRLDNDANELSIQNYGLSMTTLEDVFLSIGLKTVVTDENGDKSNMAIDMNDESLFEQPTFQLEVRSEISIFFLHIYAILYKMVKWFRRDYMALFWRVFYPVMLSVISIVSTLAALESLENSPTITMNTSLYYTPASQNIIGMSNFGYSLNPNSNPYNDVAWNTSYDQYLTNNGQLIHNDIINGSFPTESFQEFLNANKDSWPNDVVSYGSFFINPFESTPNIYLGVNVSSYVSLPVMVNLFNNWVLNTLVTPGKTITLINDPLPITDIESNNSTKVSNSIVGFSLAFVLMIAFIFVPGSGIYFIVNEKKVNTKDQQFISGLKPSAYWFGHFIGDLILSLPTIIIIFVVILILPGADSIKGDAFFPTLLTVVLFIISALPNVYLFSFLISSPGKGLAFIGIYFLIGGVLGGLMLMLTQISDLNPSEGLLTLFRVIFNSYCLTENLMTYAIKGLFDGLFDSYYDWKASTRNWVILICQSIVYFILILLLEFILSKYNGMGASDTNIAEDELDDDVLDEQERIKGILNSNGEPDSIMLSGLRKVFKSKSETTVAVKNMHFGVKKGEIFGFLGVNGAGKSTTLNMITGLLKPTSGKAYINNEPIFNVNECRKYIGYTPQSDALFDKLNGYEHLKFYAMLKGLRGKVLDNQIEKLLNILTLTEFKFKESATYSGGNKRKLSLAMSMIGNPPILLLDECSTGVDPVSRRFMWKFIQKTMKGRTIVLTTHSMEGMCSNVVCLSISLDITR